MICGEFLGYYHLSKLKEMKSSLYLIKKKPSQMLFMEMASLVIFLNFFDIYKRMSAFTYSVSLLLLV